MYRNDIEAFDNFVRDNNLFDLPLHGRSFTCYKPDGSCKSRIDRMLVNYMWFSSWPNSSLKG